MIRHPAKRAILFADIGGSSAFYNAYGDREAKQAIDQILTAIKQMVANHKGKVIKTIGDEVMCEFQSPSQAVRSAIDMQIRLSSFLKQKGLSLNIGVGFGEVLKENADLFGNVVNEAAHLTYLASGGQILISQSCFSTLDQELASFAREFDQIVYKGAQASVAIYRVYWQNEARHGSETQLMTAEINEKLGADSLTLVFQDQVFEIRAEETPFIIGRDVSQCDLLINGSEISRKHCHISYSRGKFVLIDHSTNGSYLLAEDKEEIYLRREALPLAGKIELSLGLPFGKVKENKIELQV